MKRFLTAADGKTMRPFYEVSPFIDFVEIYAKFHSEAHGLTHDEGVGFLQHYGFPTDLFDLSPSLENTRFFAAHGRENEEIGVVGVFPTANVVTLFELTDLSQHPFALRPSRQLAYAARPPRGITDLKDSRCTTLLGGRWYRFHKSQSDFDFVKKNLPCVYPAESELSYFFSDDFLRFFRSHFAYRELDEKQRRLLEDKLQVIRYQLN